MSETQPYKDTSSVFNEHTWFDTSVAFKTHEFLNCMYTWPAHLWILGSFLLQLPCARSFQLRRQNARGRAQRLWSFLQLFLPQHNRHFVLDFLSYLSSQCSFIHENIVFQQLLYDGIVRGVWSIFFYTFRLVTCSSDLFDESCRKRSTINLWTCRVLGYATNTLEDFIPERSDLTARRSSSVLGSDLGSVLEGMSATLRMLPLRKLP